MKKKRIISMILIVTLLTVMGFPGANISAYEEKAGTVNGDAVNVRQGPGTNNSNVMHGETRIQLNRGHLVTILEEKRANDGYIWYQIRFLYSGATYTGYMRSDFVIISSIPPEYTPDVDFEDYLTAQGFPESYKPGLRQLHSKYPNWVFVADRINYNWADVVSAQNVLGRSLISQTAISSHKSLATGAYNWQTGEWTKFDGGAWAAASQEIIAYCLDPRNFLDERYIFQFEALSYQPSFQNVNGVQTLVEGTFLNNSVESTTYANIFMEAASTSQVSPYYLVASVIQEQGSSGTSGLISGTYPGYAGYYNFFNYGAYAANGKTPTENGLIYASGTETSVLRPWNTRRKSIIGGAIKMGSGYVAVGQDTVFYKKFDFVGVPYTHQYMTHILGARNEGAIMSNAYGTEMKDSASLTFKIPIFNNMPETTAPYPIKTGSPNNKLSSLGVNGHSLTPSFHMNTNAYSLIVPHTTSSIQISAGKIDSKASIAGSGTKNLAYGTNTFPVVVTAENGDKRTYTLTVVREAQPVTPPEDVGQDVTLTTDYRVEENLISGVSVGTTANQAKNAIRAQGGTVRIMDKNGNETTGVLGTGSKVAVYNAAGTEKLKEYTVVLYGDINGDGSINAIDMLFLKRHILGITSLQGPYFQAANTYKNDGSINAVDMLMVKRHILEISFIEQ